MVCNNNSFYTAGKTKHKLCLKDYLIDKSKHHFKTTTQWKMLLDVFNKQKGICPYTGEKLEIGRNASLDHKISKFNGGASGPENLQWVDWRVNVMKWKMSEEEFLEVCQKVLMNKKPSLFSSKSFNI